MKDSLIVACAELEALRDSEKTEWSKIDVKDAVDKAKLKSSVTRLGEEVMFVWRMADKGDKEELRARLTPLLLSIQSELRAKGFYDAPVK